MKSQNALTPTTRRDNENELKFISFTKINSEESIMYSIKGATEQGAIV